MICRRCSPNHHRPKRRERLTGRHLGMPGCHRPRAAPLPPVASQSGRGLQHLHLMVGGHRGTQFQKASAMLLAQTCSPPVTIYHLVAGGLRAACVVRLPCSLVKVRCGGPEPWGVAFLRLGWRVSCSIAGLGISLHLAMGAHQISTSFHAVRRPCSGPAGSCGGVRVAGVQAMRPCCDTRAIALILPPGEPTSFMAFDHPASACCSPGC